MTGSADNPEVKAYTVPLTTVDRAWAVLLTGSDVNLGQGVGALDVGTYIAPRLYLSYGVSPVRCGKRRGHSLRPETRLGREGNFQPA